MIRKRFNPYQEFTNVVQDSSGRILGRYKSLGRDCMKSEVEYVKRFLISLKTDVQTIETDGPSERETMSKKTKEFTNLVWLAGVIKSLKIDDDRAMILVNPSDDDRAKYIMCTVYQEPELLATLRKFEKEDMIKINGMVRAWSQKTGDGWRNGMDVRITEIKTEPPKREVKRAQTAAASKAEDDDIPF